MKLDKQTYQKLLERKSPNSPLWRDCLLAFLIGGAICTVGEGVRQMWLSRGLDTEDTAAATAITMVFLGALLTCLHLYEKIAKYAGAGTIVPITGFANAIVSPAMEFKSEGLILGLGAKLFVIAGPVLCSPACICTKRLQNTRVRARSCRSPALQMPSFLRRWSSKARDLSSVWAQNCSLSRDRCWCTAFRQASSTVSFCF